MHRDFLSLSKTSLSFLKCPPLLSFSHSLGFQHLLLMRMSSVCKKTLLVQCGSFSLFVVVFPASPATDLCDVGSCKEGTS